MSLIQAVITADSNWPISSKGKSLDYIPFTLHEKAIGMEEHVDWATAKLSLGFT